MIILKVPYSEKDEAKALGARWHKDRKVWYVPEGQSTAPFERWNKATEKGAASAVAKGLSKVAQGRVDSHAGETIVGAHYIKLAHDCSPFIECAECRPALIESGWVAARNLSQALYEAAK